MRRRVFLEENWLEFFLVGMRLCSTIGYSSRCLEQKKKLVLNKNPIEKLKCRSMIVYPKNAPDIKYKQIDERS